MKIIVDGREAVLPQGCSFDYVTENRLFGGRDAYTLSISFPMKDCSRNVAIFGHINRADVAAQKVLFDCEIRDKGFFMFGSITITEITEAEVKAQFLEGRSEQNFDKTFDKVYINELTLGSPKITSPSDIEPSTAWDPISQNYETVALPWWNDSDNGCANNFAVYADGKYSWATTTHDLTWQPYLLFLTKKICEAVGYSYDFNAWESAEEYKNILVCNTLPGSWDMPDYSRALPNWTVDEYFEKLELFLFGEFNIDHREKKISFDFTRTVLNNIEPVKLDSVIDGEHTFNISGDDDENCEYQEIKNLVYKDQDSDLWKYYSCDWFITSMQDNILSYPDMEHFLADNKKFATWNGSTMRGSTLNKLFYVSNIDTYFIIRTVSRIESGTSGGGRPQYIYKCMPQPVNIFGERNYTGNDDSDSLEIEFVPARIDDTEEKYGPCLFLKFSSYNESSTGGYRQEIDHSAFAETSPQTIIKAGKKEKNSEYYDSIFIAYWDGAILPGGKLPHPLVENIIISDDWSSYTIIRSNLRLNDKFSSTRKVIHNINPKQKATFKWLSDVIPNPRAIFHIKGKRYICEKITATFSENGMSQLLKGEFYPLLDMDEVVE